MSVPPFDADRVRRDFPTLHREVHGRPLVYLDNAATAQKPQAVVDRLAAYYRDENSNIHRGVHHLSQAATDAYEAARERIAAYLNAAHAHEVIFTRGTTESINLVAQTFGRRLEPGDEVIVSEMEHHSNIVPWQLACEAAGARLRVIPVTDAGELDLDAYRALLSDRTRLVAVVHVSNALGTINPVEAIIADAHARGVPVLLDGAQALPHGPVDVQALDVDFYCFSGHKLFGPTGTGVLYGKEALLEALPPWQGGGDMIETVSFDGTTFAALPHKFEAGTPHIAGGLGLAAAVDYLAGLDLAGARRHEQDLLRYAADRLAGIDGLRFVGTADDKASVVSFVVDGAHPYDVGLLLDRRGIAVRTGHHCAQPLMQRYGLEGTIRASFAFYNTRGDVDALVEGVQAAVAQLRGHGAADAAPAASPPAEPEAPRPVEAIMDELAETFTFFDDPDARRDFLMEIGSELPPLPDELKTEQYRIHGCQSMVWLVPDVRDGRVHLRADSNAMITRGLIALLVRLLDGQPPQAIVDADLDAFMQRIGMPHLISASRKNGLAAMIKQVKLYALVFAKQQAATPA